MENSQVKKVFEDLLEQIISVQPPNPEEFLLKCLETPPGRLRILRILKMLKQTGIKAILITTSEASMESIRELGTKFNVPIIDLDSFPTLQDISTSVGELMTKLNQEYYFSGWIVKGTNLSDQDALLFKYAHVIPDTVVFFETGSVNSGSFPKKDIFSVSSHLSHLRAHIKSENSDSFDILRDHFQEIISRKHSAFNQ
jgi:hypothetical protein